MPVFMQSDLQYVANFDQSETNANPSTVERWYAERDCDNARSVSITTAVKESSSVTKQTNDELKTKEA